MNFYAALEIGTSKTVLAIAESEVGGRLKVTSLAEIPSAGVRKSEILDIEKVKLSIKNVIRESENRQSSAGASITIGNAYLAVSGTSIECAPYSASIAIGGGRVTDETIDEVISKSHQMPVPRNREVIEIAELDYEIDAIGGIAAPRGRSGGVLKLNTLQILTDANHLADIRSAAESHHLEIAEALFAATCAAEACIDDTERRDGVLVIDMGGGATSWAAYADGHLIDAGSIGVGGEHVTNDIAHAFQTTFATAEALKREALATGIVPEGATARVELPAASAILDSRTVSRSALNTVVNARLRELFTIIRERLEENGVMHRLHSGVVLTGGASVLNDTDELAKTEFSLPARRGRSLFVDGFEKFLDGRDIAAYLPLAGALLYAKRNDTGTSRFRGFFGGLFK